MMSLFYINLYIPINYINENYYYSILDLLFSTANFYKLMQYYNSHADYLQINSATVSIVIFGELFIYFIYGFSVLQYEYNSR